MTYFLFLNNFFLSLLSSSIPFLSYLLHTLIEHLFCSLFCILSCRITESAIYKELLTTNFQKKKKIKKLLKEYLIKYQMTLKINNHILIQKYLLTNYHMPDIIVALGQRRGKIGKKKFLIEFTFQSREINTKQKKKKIFQFSDVIIVICKGKKASLKRDI